MYINNRKLDISSRNRTKHRHLTIATRSQSKTAMATLEDVMASVNTLMDTVDATQSFATTIQEIKAFRARVHEMTQEHAKRIVKIDVKEKDVLARRFESRGQVLAKLQAEERAEQDTMRVSWSNHLRRLLGRPADVL